MSIPTLSEDPLNDLRQRPVEYELFQALRLIEAAYSDLPPLGTAAGPHDEPMRIGVDPTLDFAASDLTSDDGPSTHDSARPLRLHSRGFGLLGPNGPLPLSVTEQIRAALLHDKDPAPLRFIELLQHRLVTLFYRAYGRSRPTIQADRPADDAFSLYLGALFGRDAPVQGRGDFPDESQLFFTGRFAAATRSAEALGAIIQHEFHCPVTVTPFAVGWLHLSEAAQSPLGGDRDSSALGVATIVGSRIQDRQSRFHLSLGPLTRPQFLRFLPDGESLPILAALIEQFTRGELFCELQLLLRREEVPAVQIGSQGRLGRDSWLGRGGDSLGPADDARFVLH